MIRPRWGGASIIIAGSASAPGVSVSPIASTGNEREGGKGVASVFLEAMCSESAHAGIHASGNGGSFLDYAQLPV